MTVETLEKPVVKKSSGVVTIRPYFDPNVQNMGLEQYGLSLWDGVFHEEQLAEININGVRRYVTGLNENAPEIKLLPEDLKKAKVKEIRRIIMLLEKELATNPIDPKLAEKEDGVDFYAKVKMFRPDNADLWGQISMRLGNEPIHLDPEQPMDLIKICATEAGGFSLVGRSFEDARSRAMPPKFYLDKFQETASTQTEVKKIRNKALAALQDMFDENQVKLLYVAKVADGNSTQYKKSTPNDVIYDNMDKFINGEGVEKSRKRAAMTFLEASRQDMETLKLRSIIKDATYYKFIALKSDGFIYHMKSGEMLGRTTHDVLEFLKNPLHDQTLSVIMKDVEKLWNS
jgi:hypothetical protein